MPIAVRHARPSSRARRVRSLALAAPRWRAPVRRAAAVPRPFPMPRNGRLRPRRPAPARRYPAAAGPPEPAGTAVLADVRARRDGAVVAGGAVPERRRHSGRVRLQRLHAVRLSPGTAWRCRVKCAISFRWEIGEAGRDLEAGDLLFFTTVAPGPTHVAIAIGGDQFVHAPSSTGVVRVERLERRATGPRATSARGSTALNSIAV